MNSQRQWSKKRIERLKRNGGNFNVAVGPRLAAAAITEAETLELDGPAAGLKSLAQRGAFGFTSPERGRFRALLTEITRDLAGVTRATDSDAIELGLIARKVSEAAAMLG